MIHICAHGDIRELSPGQRVAHLAFWYMSEVYNGGHYQYFVNQRDLNHHEAITALQKIGAREQASILSSALEAIGPKPIAVPQSAEEYLTSEQAADLSAFDTRFYACEQSIETCLQEYLDRHESEFVEWTS